MFDPKKILVLAPHTDDGELGCGGSIAKFCKQGKEVHYTAFSSCQKSLPVGLARDTLQVECRKAVTSLGIDPSRLKLLDFDVREFPIKRQEILEEMVKMDKQISPELVIIPSSTDIHQDHQVIHQEALRAFRKRSVLGYELPWNENRFEANYYIQLSPEALDKKCEALLAYKSQAHRNYMQEDFIRSLARVRGVQCGQTFAEAFEVLRILS